MHGLGMVRWIEDVTHSQLQIEEGAKLIRQLHFTTKNAKDKKKKGANKEGCPEYLSPGEPPLKSPNPVGVGRESRHAPVAITFESHFTEQTGLESVLRNRTKLDVSPA